MRVRLNRGLGETLRRRCLAFETLERRDLLAVMRIVNWNTLNGPNDATGEANYQTVFQAIGNETVQGNTQRIDILALQETDPVGPGGNSIIRVQNVLNGLYPSANYQSIVTAADGGGDSTGFVYDTTSVSLLESALVDPGTLIHNVLRAKFRPASTAGESDFYVYSVHLKSGDSGADATTRGVEAGILSADADSLNEGAAILMVGDFNMQSSFETAYANLTAAGSGQVFDLAAAPAPNVWHGNAVFKGLHSQDPRMNMDDRFDIQFGSGEVTDGFGFEYVAGSYHVFGNNNTHTLGDSITTGTGASPTVLSALVAASDHLPLVADYQLVANPPNVRITETQGGTKVVEGGLYDTYQVVLDTMPTASVSVTVTPNTQVDIGNGAGVARVLTFTPGNALTPQTVVVTAPIDGVAEGTHTGSMVHTSSSADASYNGLTINGVTASIVDREAPVIVINELDSDTPSMPVNDSQEFVELYDGGVGNVSLAGKSLVFFNGNGSTSYRVIDLTGQFTNANGFFLVGNPGVSGAGLTFPNNNLQNGQDAVALYTGLFPGGAVSTTNLLDAVVYSANGATDGVGLFVLLNAGQSNVDENANSNGVNDAIARRPDGGAPRQTSTYVAQLPTPGTFNQPIPGGVQFVQSAGRVDVVEGQTTDSYQLALTSIPTANVVITVDPDNQTDLGAGVGAAIMLTFTPANALIPQLITVAAVNDMIAEVPHTSIITHTATSGDARYNGLLISNVVANITDPVVVAGDYNHNGNVDAADYVLWRHTLGSTTNTAADGSGPVTGVPNGVVDSFDYTFWQLKFGSSAPGSGAGAGITQSATVASTTSVDHAIADVFAEPVKTAPAKTSVSQASGVLQEASHADELLLALSTARARGQIDVSAHHAAASSEMESASDDVFADLADTFAVGV